MRDTSSPQVNLLDLIAFLLRWKKFLLVLTLSVAAMAAVVSLIVTPVYRSTAVVRAAEEGSGPGLASLMGSKLSVLGSLGGFGSLLGAPATGELFVMILKSRWMSERLIEAFDLRKVYGLEDVPIEQVIEKVKAHTHYQLQVETMTIQINAEDVDPKRAHAMAQFLVDELDRRNQELRSTRARREKEFVGQRLAEAKIQLAMLEDSLASFQLQTGVLNVEEQVKATIAAAASLEAQRLALQTELEMNRQLLDPQSPEIGFLRIKLASIDSSLGLLTSKKSNRRDLDVLLHLQDTPEQGLTYLRLMRDIEIQQLLVGYLTQLDEQARIEEQRNTPTLVRLDPPAVAGVRVWPRRSIMVVVAAVGAFVFGTAIAATAEFVRRAARDPSHPQHDRIQSIRQSWNK